MENTKIADPIPEAANSLGLSVSQFRRQYVATGLVKPVDLGGRGEHILYDELRAAVMKRALEQRLDPTLKKNRSSGAQAVASGVVRNPWGRSGKPRNAGRAK